LTGRTAEHARDWGVASAPNLWCGDFSDVDRKIAISQFRMVMYDRVPGRFIPVCEEANIKSDFLKGERNTSYSGEQFHDQGLSHRMPTFLRPADSLVFVTFLAASITHWRRVMPCKARAAFSLRCRSFGTFTLMRV
jgi:hypothetical protein